MSLVDLNDIKLFLSSIGLFMLGSFSAIETMQLLAYFGSFLVGVVGSVHIIQKMYYKYKDRKAGIKSDNDDDE